VTVKAWLREALVRLNPEIAAGPDRADEAYREITGSLNEQDRDDLARRAAEMAVLVKTPGRVRAVVNHIVEHYRTRVEPNGFKARVVTFDRECCVLYKRVMDELIDPEASAIVMISQSSDPPRWKVHARDKDAEERLLDRLRKHANNLTFIEPDERLEKVRERHDRGSSPAWSS